MLALAARDISLEAGSSVTQSASVWLPASVELLPLLPLLLGREFSSSSLPPLVVTTNALFL